MIPLLFILTNEHHPSSMDTNEIHFHCVWVTEEKLWWDFLEIINWTFICCERRAVNCQRGHGLSSRFVTAGYVKEPWRRKPDIGSSLYFSSFQARLDFRFIMWTVNESRDVWGCQRRIYSRACWLWNSDPVIMLSPFPGKKRCGRKLSESSRNSNGRGTCWNFIKFTQGRLLPLWSITYADVTLIMLMVNCLCLALPSCHSKRLLGRVRDRSCVFVVGSETDAVPLRDLISGGDWVY